MFMKLMFYMILISAWLPLELANFLLEKNKNKELLTLPNGLKVYYIQTENKESIVDFLYKLGDIPSNTGLYHLLEHMLSCSGNGFRKFIDQNLGKFHSGTCASSMSFTFTIHSNILKNAIENFYESIYETELDKGQISRQIELIEEEYKARFSSKDPVLFHINENFTYTDKYNLLKAGDNQYYNYYFNNIIVSGHFLTDDEPIKFTDKPFENLVEGYHSILSFLLNKKFRKFPFSVLIRTNHQKGEVIRMFDKFDKKQVPQTLIKRETQTTSNSSDQIHTIFSKYNSIRLLIRFSVPNSVNLIKFIIESLNRKLNPLFSDDISVASCMIDGICYFYILLKNVDDFDFDLLALYVFDCEAESIFLTFDELEYFLNKNEDYIYGNELAKDHYKDVILLHLLILKLLEGLDITTETIDSYNNACSLNSYKIYKDMVKVYSLVHHMIAENESLLLRKSQNIELKDFNFFRKNLLDPKNIFTLIGHKTEKFIAQKPIRCVKNFLLNLGFKPEFYYKNMQQIPSKNTNTRLKGFDIVLSDSKNSCFSLIFKFGNSLRDRIAMILLKETFAGFRYIQSARMLKLSAKITIITSFQNMLIVYISSDQTIFYNVLRSFITPLKTLSKTVEMEKVVFQFIGDANFKNKYSCISKEKLEDVNAVLKEFSSFSEITKIVETKCMYFGKQSDEICGFIANQVSQMGFRFVKNWDSPIVYKNLPFDIDKNQEYFACIISIDFDIVSTLEELINNKIILIMFKIKASLYFLNSSCLGCFSKFECSEIEDFTSIRVRVTSNKSIKDLNENITDFFSMYRDDIEKMTKKDFIKLKKLFLRTLNDCDTSDDINAIAYACKWGFLENIDVLKEKVRKYIDEKLTVESLKKILIASYQLNIHTNYNSPFAN